MDKKFKIWEKIRIWNFIVLLIGTVVLVLAVVYDGGGDEYSIWDFVLFAWPLLLILQGGASNKASKINKDIEKIDQAIGEKIRIGNPVVFLIGMSVIVVGMLSIYVNETILGVLGLFWPILLVVQLMAYYESGKFRKDIDIKKEYKEKLKNKDKELLTEIKRRKTKSLVIGKIIVGVLLIVLLIVWYKYEGRPNYIRKGCAERSKTDNRSMKGLLENTDQKEYYYSDCVGWFGIDETDQRHYDGDIWTDFFGI